MTDVFFAADYIVVVATYDNGNEEGEFNDNVEQGTFAGKYCHSICPQSN